MIPLSSSRSTFSSLSVVIPCFNEAENLPEIRKRILQALESLPLELEVIFVDDGSTDESWSQIVSLTHEDSRFRGVRLSRNFGQQEALLAGLSASRGDLIVTLDADLQDPPELIPKMINACCKGAFLVYGVRKRRSHDPILKRVFALLFYSIIRSATGLDIPSNAGEFRIARREVIHAVLSLDEPRPFLRGMFAWVGFSRAYIYYDRPNRFAGKAKFTFRKSLSLALDAFVSFSTLKERVEHFLGVLAATVGLIGFLTLPFFPSPSNLVLVTLLLFMIGIGGAYLVTGSLLGGGARMRSGRPLFVVQEETGTGIPMILK